MRYLALPLILLLAACASTMADLTPQQRVFALKSEFDLLLDQVVDYAEQPPCTATIVVACHDPSVVARAGELAFETDGVLDQAEAVVRAGGTPEDAASYAQLARAAVAQLSAYLIQEGVTS